MKSTDPGLMKRCKAAVDAHRRRARADGQVIDYTAQDLVSLATATKSCPWCGRALLTPEALAFDHARPPSRGCDARSYSRTNVVCCCRACNEQKGQMTRQEFEALLHLLEGWPLAPRVDVLARLRAGGARRFARSRKK